MFVRVPFLCSLVCGGVLVILVSVAVLFGPLHMLLLCLFVEPSAAQGGESLLLARPHHFAFICMFCIDTRVRRKRVLVHIFIHVSICRCISFPFAMILSLFVDSVRCSAGMFYVFSSLPLFAHLVTGTSV